MIETIEFSRKAFNVDAVQVTDANITAVAEWCQGDVRTSSEGKYVKVRVHRPLNDRQSKAFVGDWVLFATGTGFKAYTSKAFYKCFEQVSPDVKIHTHPPTIITPAE